VPGKPVHQPQTKEKESNINTKLIVIGVSVITVILALAGLVLGAGLAKADPVNSGGSHLYYQPSGQLGDQSAVLYDSDLEQVGVGGSPTAAGKLGHAICGYLASGVFEDELINTTMDTPGYNVTRNQAKATVLSAEWHFCPSYYVGGESA
jgi:hypothetical protein